jgi:cytochrome P450
VDQQALIDKSAKVPPMRPGWPLVGSVQELLRDPAGVLVDSYERFGPVFRLRALWNTYTVIAGPAALDFMKRRLDQEMLSRHDFFGAIEKEFGQADLTLAQSGTRHMRLRPPLSLAFSRQSVSPLVSEIAEVVRRRVQGWEMASVRPAMSELKRIAFDIFCFAMFGDASAMPYRDSLLVTEYGMNVGGKLLSNPPRRDCGGLAGAACVLCLSFSSAPILQSGALSRR